MYKKISFIATILLFVCSFSFSAEKAPIGETKKVIVYYFHGDFRCSNCIKFEEYAKETVETNFKEQLDSGKLEYKVVNVDRKENAHFVDDYKLYTKSLVLSLVKDGKEVKSKNLEKIWNYVRNKDQYIKYVTDEVNSFLPRQNTAGSQID